jgi:ubiquinol-cytochrome c reductase cytochrome c subunit
MLKALSLFAIAALSMSALAASQGPTGDKAKGKTSFERTGCWQCHGLQGQGGNEGPRIAAPVSMTWPAMSRFVRSARRSMPPYTEKVLSEQELADIYAYLQSIPSAPDFTTIPLLNAMNPDDPARRPR